jgi:SAM-dependent methyltransferase
LAPPQLEFLPIEANRPLPFADGEFSLTTCVSVMEFVPTDEGRRKLVDELKRVTRPGGYVYLATPNPFRPSRVHKKWLIGDIIFRDGVPWSWPPGRVAAAFADCHMVPLARFRMREIFRKRGSGTRLPDWVCRSLVAVMPWQKALARVPGGGSASN